VTIDCNACETKEKHTYQILLPLLVIASKLTQLSLAIPLWTGTMNTGGGYVRHDITVKNCYF